MAQSLEYELKSLQSSAITRGSESTESRMGDGQVATAPVSASTPAPAPAPAEVVLARPDSARWVTSKPGSPLEAEKRLTAEQGDHQNGEDCCTCSLAGPGGISEAICNTYWLSADSRNCLQDILDQQWVVIGTSCATMVSLLAPDIAQLAFDSRADFYVNLALLACVTIFIVELFLASLARRGYFLSFFWALDLVATVSIAISIPYADFGGGEGDCGAESVVESNDFVTQAGRTLRLVRQGGRALRVVRALRLVALVKAFGVVTQCCRTDAQREREERLDEAMGDELTADKSTQATRIGRHLAFLSSVRVVYIILLLSITLPFAVNDVSSLRGKESIATLLGFIATDPERGVASVASAIDTVDSIDGIDFLRVRLNSTVYRDRSLQDVRCSDLVRIDIEQLDSIPGIVSENDGGSSAGSSTQLDEVTFDAKKEADARSVFNLVYVSVVLVVLVLSIVLSDRETRYFVVKPLLRITRILASLRQKLAQSFIDLDEAEWETEVVERYVVSMAQWVEHQQRRGLLPTEAEEAAENRAQRRLDEAEASQGSIAAHGRLFLTRTASGLRQLLDWGGGNGSGGSGTSGGKGRRHTLGGAAAGALASDLMVSKPWEDGESQRRSLLHHRQQGDLTRRSTMLPLRHSAAVPMDGGGATGRMRRMQSALPGAAAGGGRPLWRNQSMRFYGDAKPGIQGGVESKGSSLAGTRPRAGSDSAAGGSVSAAPRHRTLGGRTGRGGDSFVDYARDDEMGGVDTSELPTGLVGLGKFIRRDAAGRPATTSSEAGRESAATKPEAEGEFPVRANRTNSDGQSTTKDYESVVQLWHHEGGQPDDADLGGAIGHWDSSASRSAAARRHRSAIPPPPPRNSPRAPETDAIERDSAPPASVAPTTLASAGRSRSHSGQAESSVVSASHSSLPPAVSRLESAPTGHSTPGTSLSAGFSNEPQQSNRDTPASPSSDSSRQMHPVLDELHSTRERHELGISPQLGPSEPLPGALHAAPTFLLREGSDTPRTDDGVAGAESGAFAVASDDVHRAKSPMDSTAIAPLQSRRFSGLGTGFLGMQIGQRVPLQSAMSEVAAPAGTRERRSSVASAASAATTEVAEFTEADLHHGPAGLLASSAARRSMPRVMSSRDLDEAAMQYLGFTHANALPSARAGGSFVSPGIARRGRMLTPVQEDAAAIFEEANGGSPESQQQESNAATSSIQRQEGIIGDAAGKVNEPAAASSAVLRTARRHSSFAPPMRGRPGRTRSMLAIRSPWELSDEQIIRETPVMAETVRLRQESRVGRLRSESSHGRSATAGVQSARSAAHEASAAGSDGDDVRHFLANNGIIIVRELEAPIEQDFAVVSDGVVQPGARLEGRAGRSASDPPAPNQRALGRRQSRILLDPREHVFDPSGPLGVLNRRTRGNTGDEE